MAIPALPNAVAARSALTCSLAITSDVGRGTRCTSVQDSENLVGNLLRAPRVCHQRFATYPSSGMCHGR